MTHEAKVIVANILLAAEERLAGAPAFWILADLVDAYHEEWGWSGVIVTHEEEETSA